MALLASLAPLPKPCPLRYRPPMNLDRLRVMFLRERRRFAAVYPHCADAALGIKKFKRHHERDCCMAYVGTDRPEIFFHVDVIDLLTEPQCLALVRHELAHVCEPRWKEAAVDRLAEEISGRGIYYGPDDIQTTSAAACNVRPRPKRLPK